MCPRNGFGDGDGEAAGSRPVTGILSEDGGGGGGGFGLLADRAEGIQQRDTAAQVSRFPRGGSQSISFYLSHRS